MENVWTLAALWVGLALVATNLAHCLNIAVVLTELVVGTFAQLISSAPLIRRPRKSKTGWITSLARADFGLESAITVEVTTNAMEGEYV